MKTIQNLQTKAANKQAGFTLIELMIVVAIVAILAAVALPAYFTYVQKSNFADVVAAAQSYKLKVELCYNMTGDMTTCDAGAHAGTTYAIPAAISAADGNIASMDVANGVITGTGVTEAGGYTYIITPNTSGSAGRVTWAQSGTCQAADFC
ncbi:pilin [Agarivorans sp.]|uniref:pilin n=1 Tax=Agarivorans sp. TaxID=1872412 RepID=UPI003D093691